MAAALRHALGNVRRGSVLSCRELIDLVTEYLEGALDREQRVRFEAHLRECGGCRAHLAQMRSTIDAVGRITEESLAPHVLRELTEAFAGWRAAPAGSHTEAKGET